MKRLLDLVGGVGGLILISPVFVVVAGLVWIGDRGPVFYRQVRVGRFGREFKIWKFRTMRVGADQMGPAVTKGGDNRITLVGRLLRKTKIDEIPQLLNVVAGEMSFVGPRPEVPRYVGLYSEAQRRVLDLKPGITDLASLRFRNEEELLARAEEFERFYREVCIPRKIELNLEYAAKASVWNDTKLIVKTVLAVAGLGGVGGADPRGSGRNVQLDGSSGRRRDARGNAADKGSSRI